MHSKTPFDDSWNQSNMKQRFGISANDLAQEVGGRLLTSPQLDERTARVRQFADDLFAFGSHYFPHYVSKPPAQFHKTICAELARILASKETERFACAAPRGVAKTTWVSLIFALFCIVYRRKRFIILFTKNLSLASTLISDLKEELEHNHRLASDFPDACGRGRVWRCEEIETNSGVKVLGATAGSTIRGRKYREHRPDLFILDDIEDDEHVRSLDQRDKLADWVHKALLNAKALGAKADFLVIGTIFHNDSVLSRLLDPARSPGWRGRKFKAVVRWSTRPDLWDLWTAVYTDVRRSLDERRTQARQFFESHRDEMLKGTEVIWQEAESYLELMTLRVDQGVISFNCEKQNEPLDPSVCEFSEACFRLFDEVVDDGEIWLQPDSGQAVKVADCDVFGALDPSMGRHDKNRDPSAIVSVAAYPSRRISADGIYRAFYVIDADIQRRHPKAIIEQILVLYRRRRYTKFGVEAVQFQELLAENLQEAAPDLPVVKLKPREDKKLRIQALSPRIHSGALFLKRSLTTLQEQLLCFPQADHDDGPDALAQCLQMIGAFGLEVQLVTASPAEEKRLHPYDQQLREALPDMFVELEGTCGSCINVKRHPGGQLRCGLSEGMIVTADLPACPNYDPD